MHTDEEMWEQGLLEKYVLGLCNSSEQKHVEALIAKNPELTKKIGEMQKAVKCYCTSCYSDKIKSILSGKHSPKSCQTGTESAHLLDMNEDRGVRGFWGRLKSSIGRLFSQADQH